MLWLTFLALVFFFYLTVYLINFVCYTEEVNTSFQNYLILCIHVNSAFLLLTISENGNKESRRDPVPTSTVKVIIHLI